MTPRVIVITGAGSGIGKASAEVLAGSGDIVVCADLDIEAARRTAEPLPGASSTRVDVSDRKATEGMVARVVQQFGRVDALVHSAGIADRTGALDLTDDVFDRVISVNAKGTFIVGQAVARQLIAQGTGGSMVLVAS